MTHTQYEAVIGLEVHARLASQTKIFSSAPAAFGANPNDHVSAGDAALPGTLPVLNRHAVTLALRAGVALDCHIQKTSVFDRKSYFYPDLPSGYQISQNDFPICLGGRVRFELEGASRTVPLTRIHMEQDAGKLTHEGDKNLSQVDLNRAGNPLIEIVTDPAMHTPEEAAAFLRELRAILVAIGTNDGNMAEGSLRCDANVSVRPVGTDVLGTRAEIKNLNSFRNLRDALRYEIRRQIEVLNDGGTLVQETRLWNALKKETGSMREKEDATDYRYVPDPDIPPLVIDDAWLQDVTQNLGELPAAQRKRLQSTYGLSAYDAGVLVDGTGYVALLDAMVEAGAAPKPAANLIHGPVATAVNDRKLIWVEERQQFVSIDRFIIEGRLLADLLALESNGIIHAGSTRTIFEQLLKTGEHPEAIVEQLGLRQVQDDDALDRWIDEALAQKPEAAKAYRNGRKKALGAVLGTLMRASGGKANPNTARKRLVERLEEESS